MSCQRKNQAPEEALQAYITQRLEGRLVNRNEILNLATGKYKDAISALNDEEFSTFESLKNIKKNTLKMIDSNCSEKDCTITYSLAYDTMVNDKKTFSSEVKKVAEMKLEDGIWKIADINTLKTFHESLESLK